MFSKILYFLVVLVIPMLTKDESKSIGFGSKSNCLIHNGEYKFEFLYSVNDNKTKEINKKTRTYLLGLVKVNDFNKLRWSLIQTNNHSGQYYLKSSFYGDYLCAKSVYADIFNTKRIVIRQKIKSNFLIPFDNCKWKITQVDSNTSNNTYLIANVFFKQPLFADSSYFFPDLNFKKEIFLSNNKKDLTTRKVKWMIDCIKGKI